MCEKGSSQRQQSGFAVQRQLTKKAAQRRCWEKTNDERKAEKSAHTNMIIITGLVAGLYLETVSVLMQASKSILFSIDGLLSISFIHVVCSRFFFL